MTWLVAWMSAAAIGADRPHTVVVEVPYPGASATAVAETVAAPIEQQTAGLPQALDRISKSTDGRYVLAIALKENTNPNAALTAVRDRLALAEPMLPEEARRRGVTVRLKTPPLAIVTLTSPDGKYDVLFLSDYAALRLRDELQRIPGVGDVTLIGKQEYHLRAHLDPDRLRAFNLSPAEVLKTLQKDAPKAGAQPAAAALDRLKAVESLERLVLQTTPSGQPLLLRDVARLELGAENRDRVLSKRCPGVAMVVAPTSDADLDALHRQFNESLNRLRPALPDDMHLDADFIFHSSDRQTPEFLALDLLFPDGVSQERLVQSLTDYETTLRRVPGVANVLALTSDPFDPFSAHPCLLLRLSPLKERKSTTDELVRRIRFDLERFPDARLRIRRIPSDPAQLSFAVCGPEMDKVRMLADQCVQRWRSIDAATDLRFEGSVLGPRIEFDVDRDKVKAMGVSLDEVANTLAFVAGPAFVGDIDGPNGRMPLTASLAENSRLQPESIRALTIRNKDGQVIPLATIVAVKHVIAPNVIERVDGRPAMRLTMSFAKTPGRTSIQEVLSRLRIELKLSSDYTLSSLQN